MSFFYMIRIFDFHKIIGLWNERGDPFKSATVFTLAILLSRGIAFISTPIFTRIMPPDQIGLVGLFTSTMSMIVAISSLALTSGGFSVGLKEFSNYRDEYVSSVVTLTTITGGVFLLVFLSAPAFWTHLLGLPFGLVLLIVLGCMVTPAYEFWLMRQRYEYAYKNAAIVTALSAVLSTAFAVCAVLLAKDHPSLLGEVRLYVSVGCTLFVNFIIWVILLRKGNKKSYMNKTYWTFSLSLSLPLLGHSFASQVLSVSDRLLISKLADNASVGIYSTLYTVGAVIMMFWGALNLSFVPYLFQNADDLGKRKDISRNAQILLLCFSGLAVFAALIAPDLVRILATDEYYKYVFIVPPITAGVYLVALGNFYSNLLVLCKNTMAIMVSTVMAGVVSVLLNILLIPLFGFVVAAYTTLFAYVVYALMQALLGYRIFSKKFLGPFVYNNFVMAGIAVGTVLLTLCSMYTYQCSLLRYTLVALLMPLVLKIYFCIKQNK